LLRGPAWFVDASLVVVDASLVVVDASLVVVDASLVVVETMVLASTPSTGVADQTRSAVRRTRAHNGLRVTHQPATGDA
jgi:hypothetical protein